MELLLLQLEPATNSVPSPPPLMVFNSLVVTPHFWVNLKTAWPPELGLGLFQHNGNGGILASPKAVVLLCLVICGFICVFLMPSPAHAWPRGSPACASCQGPFLHQGTGRRGHTRASGALPPAGYKQIKPGNAARKRGSSPGGRAATLEHRCWPQASPVSFPAGGLGCSCRASCPGAVCSCRVGSWGEWESWEQAPEPPRLMPPSISMAEKDLEDHKSISGCPRQSQSNRNPVTSPAFNPRKPPEHAPSGLCFGNLLPVSRPNSFRHVFIIPFFLPGTMTLLAALSSHFLRSPRQK